MVGFATTWLARRLPGFIAAHPKTQVRIVSSIWAAEYDAETFDLDIRYGFGAWPGFRADRLNRESLVPLCLPEIAARLQSPADLRVNVFCMSLATRTGWGSWLTAAGAGRVDASQGLWFDTTLMAMAVAAEGGGIALGRTSLIETELSQGRLVKPFAFELPIEEGFFLVAPKKAPATRTPPSSATGCWPRLPGRNKRGLVLPARTARKPNAAFLGFGTFRNKFRKGSDRFRTRTALV